MVGEDRWAFGFGGAIHSKGDGAIRRLHRVSLQEERSPSGRTHTEGFQKGERPKEGMIDWLKTGSMGF